MFLSCNNSNVGKNYSPAFERDSARGNVLTLGVPSIMAFNRGTVIIDYINAHLENKKVRLVPSLSYDDYLAKLRNREFDLTIVNGIEALDAEKNGYSILCKLGDDEGYRSIIVVKKGSGIDSIGDLKNKVVSIPGNTRVPGTMMGLYFLHEQGLDVKHDIKRITVPSFETSLLDTYLGKCDAGISLLIEWNFFKKQNADIAAQLVAKWTTPPTINNALVVRSDIDSSIASRIVDLLFNLPNSPDGIEVLKKFGITKFEPATSENFLPLKKFYEKSSAVIN